MTRSTDRGIAVGDLVMIVRDCCSTHLGCIFRVQSFTFPVYPQFARCHKCGYRDSNIHIAIRCPTWGIPLSWLKRIPPLDELESERTDETSKEPA